VRGLTYSLDGWCKKYIEEISWKAVTATLVLCKRAVHFQDGESLKSVFNLWEDCMSNKHFNFLKGKRHINQGWTWSLHMGYFVRQSVLGC
jgi:hypothetical protein